jgi:hypothetical protein
VQNLLQVAIVSEYNFPPLQEVSMAREIPISSPAPAASASQPNSPVPPTIDYYEKIVERSHKEIEWVRSAYKLLGGFIVALGIVIIGSVAYLSFNTVHDLKKDLKEDVKEAKEQALKDVQAHITKQKEEVTEGKAKALQEVQLHINKQIAEQFSAPNIKTTLETVAATEAKGIIDKQIGPVINETKSAIIALEERLRQHVDQIRADYQAELEDLRKEVDFQKKLREIQNLQNQAVGVCSLKAYEKLKTYQDESVDLILAARSAVFAIKGFFLTTTLFGDETVNKIMPDGSSIPFKAIATDKLLEILPSEELIRNRGVIVRILSRKKECNVPEALLKVINSDESLCVRHEAKRSFQSVTSFKETNTLDFQEAQAWYDKNREEVRKNIGCKEQ